MSYHQRVAFTIIYNCKKRIEQFVAIELTATGKRVYLDPKLIEL